MENGKYKLGVESRLTAVEVKLDEVINNHLAHLSTDIEAINNKLWWAMGLAVTVLLGVVTDLILRFIK